MLKMLKTGDSQLMAVISNHVEMEELPKTAVKPPSLDVGSVKSIKQKHPLF